MNDTNGKNSFCDYIYKKGDKKGLKCNVMNCILHVKNSKTMVPMNLPPTSDKILDFSTSKSSLTRCSLYLSFAAFFSNFMFVINIFCSIIS